MTTSNTYQGPVVDYYGPVPPKSILDAIVCPPWCLGHFVDGEDVEGRLVTHYGPAFDRGDNISIRLSTWSDGTLYDNPKPTASVAVEEYEVGPERLREIADSLAAAAAWLEAHR